MAELSILVDQENNLKGGTAPQGLIFEDFVHFLKKTKQLWTKYPMDLVRNVPRNSKITVLLQHCSIETIVVRLQ